MAESTRLTSAAGILTFQPNLSRIDTQRVVAVLEKAIERLQLLSLLNYDLGSGDASARNAAEDTKRGVGSILEEQKRLEARYEALIAATQKVRPNPMDPSLDPTCFAHVENRQEKEQLEELKEISAALKEQSKLLCRQLKDNPNDSDNWRKIVGERNELITLLTSCIRELTTSTTTLDQSPEVLASPAASTTRSMSSYEVFAKKVLDEQSASQWADELVKKEKETNQNVKQLQNEVKHERQLKEEELEKRHKEIAELKTELRILKQNVKESMEKLRCETEAGSEAQQRKAQDVQRVLRNQLKSIQDRIHMEQQVYGDLKGHIEAKTKTLEARHTEWLSEAKQREAEKEKDKYNATQDRERVAKDLRTAQENRDAQEIRKKSREEEQKRKADEKARAELDRDARFNGSTKLQAALKGFFTRQALIPLKKKFGKKKK